MIADEFVKFGHYLTTLQKPNNVWQRRRNLSRPLIYLFSQEFRLWHEKEITLLQWDLSSDTIEFGSDNFFEKPLKRPILMGHD